MKNFINDNGNKNIFLTAFISAAIGIAALLILVTILALMMTWLELSVSSAPIISVVALIISSAICGIASVKIYKSKAVIVSALAGVFLFLIIAVISAAIVKIGFTSAFFIRIIIAVVSSVFGGLLAAFRKTNKYI